MNWSNHRYHRQVILPQIGPAGQQRLANARILLVGCGALGTVIAEQLIRSGIGYLRIVDRDIVELGNLQRQVLFDEADVQASLPKAIAAERRLREINSSVEIDARVADVHSGNILKLMEGVTLILDGTDNVETRYLINDAAVKMEIPWVYGGCVGVEGRVMGIAAGACLRCVFPNPPRGSELPTCETAGVLVSASAMVASMQVIVAMKILLGMYEQKLFSFDIWAGRFHAMSVEKQTQCPCCGRGKFEFLESDIRQSTTLCGRNSVQLTGSGAINLGSLGAQLKSAGEVESTPYLVRCKLREPSDMALTVFEDGRLLVHGTNDPARARALAARFVGA